MALLKKKEVPLVILEEIERELDPLFKDISAFFHLIKDENSLYSLIDDDLTSNFFFKIKEHQLRSSDIYYLMEQKPTDKYNLASYEGWVPLKELINRFNKWVSILKNYESVNPTIYNDDPILKSYQESFKKKFDIVDADADTNPFDLEQQIYINTYLNKAKDSIKKLMEGRPEDEQKKFKELEMNVTEIQKNITTETKRKVFEQLTLFWAKAQKIGLDVIKEIFISVSSEIIKKLITSS